MGPGKLSSVFIEESPAGVFSAPPPSKPPGWDGKHTLLPASDYPGSSRNTRYPVLGTLVTRSDSWLNSSLGAVSLR
jgi:hypothetical protein